jgi:intraflagellar transport protein 81
MGRDEFKQYAASLRNKTNSYKRMKAELRDVRAEMALLSRTEQILKSRAGNIDDLMRKLESEQGIEG